MPNLRDLGGLPGRKGRTRFGRVARGPRRESLDATGWRGAAAWGLRTIIDLRCDYEIGSQDGDPVAWIPDTVTVVQAPTEDHEDPAFQQTCFPILDSPAYWPHNLRLLPDLVRGTLEAIAEEEPGVLVHCSAGRDRTGMVSAILLANAGVAPEVIADDHELSVRAMAGRASHAPTYDAQTTWGEQEIDEWVDTTRPLVIWFARDVPGHLDALGLGDATGQAALTTAGLNSQWLSAPAEACVLAAAAAPSRPWCESSLPPRDHCRTGTRHRVPPGPGALQALRGRSGAWRPGIAAR
ncbi:tyrosine-protein phosphatase [Luteococcus peritonei]|uniref:Tyrosine-protein phosphatase n=1 Tax=Luteococcus peritonei TaxID=88874 RepID=A0ABW4RYH3_9ACTN